MRWCRFSSSAAAHQRLMRMNTSRELLMLNTLLNSDVLRMMCLRLSVYHGDRVYSGSSAMFLSQCSSAVSSVS